MSQRSIFIAVVLAASFTLAEEPQTQYWRLGAGLYTGWSRGTELDGARWDWLVLGYTNMSPVETAVKELNRNLQLNPRQKYLGRLWPINGLGKAGRYHHGGTMFDYQYRPGVKEALEKQLRRQIRGLLDNITKPQNVVGFTFLEELPGHWGAGDQIFRGEVGKMPPILEEFRVEIEQDRGALLVWDDQTRRWAGELYARTLDQIHKVIKKEAPEQLVLYWHHTGYHTLDDLDVSLPADAPLSSNSLCSVHFADIIKPGVCEGFMAYPNNAAIWENKYMRHVRKNGWLFFSQLSHPGYMRLQGWQDALAMAKTKVPQNLGYALYCQGDCAAKKVSNDDPSVPHTPEESAFMGSIPLHGRRFCDQEGIGMDVVNTPNTEHAP